MREGWRWFGPDDPVSLSDVRQAGATDVVTALHNVPIGMPWTKDAVLQRQAIVAAENGRRSRLDWTVVESIPVHDDVKVKAPGHERYVEAFVKSMEAVAAAGIRVICYNFMPVIDWTRTDLAWELPSGGKALRFDADAFCRLRSLHPRTARRGARLFCRRDRTRRARPSWPVSGGTRRARAEHHRWPAGRHVGIL